MNIVAAFSTSRAADWRWRILNVRGEVVEESSTRFPTIAAAVAAGQERARGLTELPRGRPAGGPR